MLTGFLAEAQLTWHQLQTNYFHVIPTIQYYHTISNFYHLFVGIRSEGRT